MRTLKLLILFFSISVNLLYANTSVTGNNTRFSKEQVDKDMFAKKYTKYQDDNLKFIKKDALIEKRIVGDLYSALFNRDNILVNNAEITRKGDFVAAANCAIVNDKYTATIYDFDMKNGALICMVAPRGDLNNPIGKFKITYPNAKNFYAKNIRNAREFNAHHILNSVNKFQPVYEEIEDIKRSVQQNSDYLSLTDLIQATVLTDSSIIDVEASKNTNRIQLKDNVTAKVFNDTNSAETYNDNSAYILDGLVSLLSVYIKFSNLSMEFFIILLGFLVTFGLIGKVYESFKEKKLEKAWVGGIFIGLALFFPFYENQESGDQYEILTTKYQSFERSGYSLFAEWANRAASAVIDTEIESLIARAGIGTKEQIINGYAAKIQYTDLAFETEKINEYCSIKYDTFNMYLTSNRTKYLYSDNSSSPFPTSESWAHAMSLYNDRGDVFYRDLPLNTNSNSAYSQSVKDKYNAIENKPDDSKIGDYFYPEISLSACGKNYFNSINFKQKQNEYTKLYQESISETDFEYEKLLMIKQIVKFQYELKRDFGFLSVIGIPIVKFQTKMIGGLYSNDTETLDKLNQEIGGDGLLHSFFSSIPYMFVPGAASFYQHSLSTMRDMKNGFQSSAAGMVGGFFGGGIVTSAAANAAGFSMAYIISKNILIFLPLLGIFAIGLLRYIVIVVKILIFHFGALFMLPIAIFQKNIKPIANYSLKILLVMFELPVFVYSIFIADMANELLQNVGTLFSKTIIKGMIDNNLAQHKVSNFTWESITNLNFQFTDTMKIFIVDGLMQVAISLFSVYLIYKIIATLHTALFELFELKGTEALDGMIEGIRQDAASKGGKI
jgi:hypothetical protein